MCDQVWNCYALLSAAIICLYYTFYLYGLHLLSNTFYCSKYYLLPVFRTNNTAASYSYASQKVFGTVQCQNEMPLDFAGNDEHYGQCSDCLVQWSKLMQFELEAIASPVLALCSCGHTSYKSPLPLPAVVYFFQAGAPFCTGLNSEVMPKNWQISCMHMGLLSSPSGQYGLRPNKGERWGRNRTICQSDKINWWGQEIVGGGY